MHSENDIDKLFREGLENLEAQPSEKLWGKIHLGLDAMQQSKAASFLLFLYSGLFVLIASLPIAYLLFASAKSNPEGKQKSLVASDALSNTDATLVVPQLSSSSKENSKSSGIKAIHFMAESEEMLREITPERMNTLSANPILLSTKSIDKVNTRNAGLVADKTPTGKATDQPKGLAENPNQTQPKSTSETSQETKELLQNPWAMQQPETKLQVEMYTPIDNLPLRKLSSLAVLEQNEKIQAKEYANTTIPHEFYRLNGLHIGAVAALNNVWILNQNTYGYFGKARLAYRLKTGFYYGIVAGYDIGNRLGVQAEYHFQNTMGQDYSDVWRKQRINREVNLSYSSIPVFIKFRIPMISNEFNRPASINVMAGAQYSRLHTAVQKINNTEYEITERFKQEDVAVVVGLEYNGYISDRFFFSAGVRTGVGLKDINDENWTKLPNQKSSRNSFVGANFGVHYKIFK